MEIFAEYGYWGLFAVSFLAATILPIGSEFLFAAMILAKYNPWLCLITASTGNTLGGMTNYVLGRLGKIKWIEKYLKVKPAKIEKVKNWLKYKGALTAFFSFMPVFGDMIALVLGFMRANVYVVSTAMFAGKFLRYWLLMQSITQSLKFLGY